MTSSITNENKYLHNALRQSHHKASSFSLRGFSISGLASYHQLPELDLIVDLGECPLSAVPLDHVFLTHAHGDHSRCLMRHHSLRKMVGIPKDAVYYLPEEIYENAKAWIKAEATFENVPDYKFRYPKIHPMTPKMRVPLAYRKDLVLESFSVKHSIPAMGCTLYRFKKKLKQEYLKAAPSEIIALRAAGVQVTNDVYDPLISFMGDCKTESLIDNEHVFSSSVLVTECTFIEDDDEEMAKVKSHSHLNDIVRILNDMEQSAACEMVILNHFSMKYSEKQILKALETKIPDAWKEKVKVLL